jgi:hypothetical protein
MNAPIVSLAVARRWRQSNPQTAMLSSRALWPLARRRLAASICSSPRWVACRRRRRCYRCLRRCRRGRAPTRGPRTCTCKCRRRTQRRRVRRSCFTRRSTSRVAGHCSLFLPAKYLFIVFPSAVFVCCLLFFFLTALLSRVFHFRYQCCQIIQRVPWHAHTQYFSSE